MHIDLGRRQGLWCGLSILATMSTVLAIPFGVSVILLVSILVAGLMVRRWLALFLVASLFASALLGRELTHELWRPWFRNEYGRNDRMILRQWDPGVPAIDCHGDVMAADFKVNVLLLVIASANEDSEDRDQLGMRVWHGIMFEGDRTGVPVHCAMGKDSRIEMRGRTNRFIIVLPDGTTLEMPLGPGRAEDFFLEKSDPYVPFLLGRLERRTEWEILTCIERLADQLEATSRPSGTAP